MKVIVVSLIFLSFIRISYSLDYLDEFFNNILVGEEFQTISNENSDIKIYMFIDRNSCFACLGIISELENYFSDSLLVESVIFFGGKDESTAEQLIAKYQWKSKLIFDYNDIYSKFYKVRKLPALIILDSKNKVVFFDKLGGMNTSKKTLDEIRNRALNNRMPNKHNFLKSIQVKDEKGKDVYASHIRTIYYLRNANEYLFNSDYNKKILRLDSNGKVISQIDIDKILKKDNKIGVNLIHYDYDEKTNKIAMNLNTGGILQHLLIYDFDKQDLAIISIDSIKKAIKGDVKPELDLSCDFDRNIIYLNCKTKEMSSKLATETEPQLLKIYMDATKDIKVEVLNYLPSVRKNYDIYGFNYSMSNYFDNHIFTTNMFSDEAFELNNDGDVLTVYNFEGSTHYRFNPQPMLSLKRDEFLYFRGRASINEYTLIDEKRNKLYVYICNLSEINDDNIKLRLRNPTERYLLEFNIGNPELVNEYKLPDNNIPFSVEDGIVRTSTFDGEVTINLMKLSQLNH